MCRGFRAQCGEEIQTPRSVREVSWKRSNLSGSIDPLSGVLIYRYDSERRYRRWGMVREVDVRGSNLTHASSGGGRILGSCSQMLRGMNAVKLAGSCRYGSLRCGCPAPPKSLDRFWFYRPSSVGKVSRALNCFAHIMTRWGAGRGGIASVQRYSCGEHLPSNPIFDSQISCSRFQNERSSSPPFSPLSPRGLHSNAGCRRAF